MEFGFFCVTELTKGSITIVMNSSVLTGTLSVNFLFALFVSEDAATLVKSRHLAVIYIHGMLVH